MSESRTYGGWRRRRGIGLLGLDTAATFTFLILAAAVLVIAAVAPALLFYMIPPTAVFFAAGLIRMGGVSLAHLGLVKARWTWGIARGYHRYLAGPIIDHPRAFQLPGVLAPLALMSAADGEGDHYGIIWHRRTGTLTATLRVVPSSTWLADRHEADVWVGSWGTWLAGLGYQPAIRWVTVTVDTAPEPGTTLSDTFRPTLDPNAPAQARGLMEKIVEAAPATAADVDTRVSITFDPRRSPTAPKNLADAVDEFTSVLDGLVAKLNGCGVTVLGRATAAEIAGIVRTAFDPHARGEVNHLLGDHRDKDMLTWSDAGPVHAVEHPDRYEHDGGISACWGWFEPPRQNVNADILTRLVAPGEQPKRVTLLYRPLPSAMASQVLQQEVNAAAFRAQFRRKTGRDESARDSYDQARARQAAAEEAAGAGVCLVSLYATVTVTDPDELPRAIAQVEASADASKIRLRRSRGSQATTFATTLPCGICPPDLARRR